MLILLYYMTILQNAVVLKIRKHRNRNTLKLIARGCKSFKQWGVSRGLISILPYKKVILNLNYALQTIGAPYHVLKIREYERSLRGFSIRKKMHPERDLLALGHSGPLKILTAPKQGLLSIRLDLIYLDWWGFPGGLRPGVGNWTRTDF